MGMFIGAGLTVATGMGGLDSPGRGPAGRGLEV